MLLVALSTTGVAWSAFTMQLARSSTFATALTFDDYPTAVGRQAPLFHHRLDESPSGSSSSVAVDARGQSGGMYAGRTDGPSLRWKLDESSGTAAADASGGANPGTTVGTTWSASGHEDGGLAFSAANASSPAAQYASSARVPVDSLKSYTVSTWMLMDGSTNVSQTAVSLPGASSSAFLLGWRTDTASWRFKVTAFDGLNPDTFNSEVGATPALGTWHHLVGVFDRAGSTIRLYVNGVAGPSVPVPATLWTAAATNSLQVGRARWNSTWTDGVNGRVDDVRTYRRALTQAEVTSIYDASPYLGRWDFEESSGTTAADTSGIPGAKNLTLGSDNGPVPQLGQSGKSGRGLALQAASKQYASTGTSPVVPTGSSYTLSAWVLTSTLGSYVQAVSQSADTGSYFWLGFDGTSGNGKWVFGIASSGSTAGIVLETAPLGASPANTWTHLVATYDRSLARLYVDGVEVDYESYTQSWVPGAIGGLQVGRGRSASTAVDHWPGSIDQVHVYNRALTRDEVTALHSHSGQGTEPSSLENLPMAGGMPGALQGAQQGQAARTGVAFAGVTNGYDTSQRTPSATFSVECWFRVAPGQGGSLVGFSNSQTGDGVAWNLNLYVDVNGYVRFGVNNGAGAVPIVASDARADDGQWHHAVGTSGAQGLRLYIDGVRQAAVGDALTTVQSYDGYWRWGGSRLQGWTAAPANWYLVGSLDEVAVYPVQLTEQQVLWHYYSDY